MDDYGALVTIVFLFGALMGLLLPTILAFYTGNRFRWFFLIANLFVPLKPPIWIALLIGAMVTSRR